MSNSSKKHVVLMGDDLDRGDYAMTLCKIIADYSPRVPKKGYEVLYETIDLGEIITGEITIPAYFEDEKDGLLPSQENFHPKKTEHSTEVESTANPNYTGRLHHLDNAAFIMAISGSWGTGKTTFVDLLKNLLLDDKIIDKGDEKDTIEKYKFEKDEIVKFDAWKHDFYDDPMIPFSRMLIETVCVKGTDEFNDASEQFNGYLKLLHKSNYEVAVETVTGLLSESSKRTILPKEARAIVDNIRTNIQKKDQTLSDGNLSLEERIFAIQDILQKCIRKKSQKKVVVIVDELDRCKPTFAIQLLEVVKHLFNIKGLVFIFSLDIAELQHCVKTVYGQDFDAIGYLERFFDYNSMLPKGNEEKLFDTFSKEYELPEDYSQYYDLCQQFSLTPREMKGICSSFYYLNKYELDGYPEKARLLYFYILLLKYKFPDKVQKLNAKDPRARTVLFRKYRPEFLNVSNADPQPFYTAVIKNKSFAESDLFLIDSEGKIKGSKLSLTSDQVIQIGEQESISNILFAKDLQSDISNLCNLHILEFLFNKVESYGSAIPVNKKEDKVQRGSILHFGHWYKTKDKDKEPIEWYVLDVQDNMALLISRYGIDCQLYNTEGKEVTWETCSLRKWLNGYFLENAFDKEEQERIALSDVVAERNPVYPKIEPGNDTKDKVYLLSIEEAARYFPSDEARKCIPTDYAISMNVYVDKENGATVWWLRSSGSRSYFAALVLSGGSVDAYGYFVGYDGVGVRPVLRINL